MCTLNFGWILFYGFVSVLPISYIGPIVFIIIFCLVDLFDKESIL